jgi:hypothetical protein
MEEEDVKAFVIHLSEVFPSLTPERVGPFDTTTPFVVEQSKESLVLNPYHGGVHLMRRKPFYRATLYQRSKYPMIQAALFRIDLKRVMHFRSNLPVEPA